MCSIGALVYCCQVRIATGVPIGITIRIFDANYAYACELSSHPVIIRDKENGVALSINQQSVDLSTVSVRATGIPS